MKNAVQKVVIKTEYIELGQFLKFVGIIDQGGQAKFYLSENAVKVNGEDESRRGRKLRPGEVVEIDEKRFEIVSQ
ncbi:MAG: S4 domain-containing protein YaaA [Bacilli bacterium]|nr:S4 domain-containing protein YaaA [Bacilli bacterium]